MSLRDLCLLLRPENIYFVKISQKGYADAVQLHVKSAEFATYKYHFLYYSAGTCLNVYCFHLFEQNKAFRSLNELDLSFWRNILFLETITISSTFSTQHHRSE